MPSSLNVRVLYQGEKRALNTSFEIYAILMDSIKIHKPPRKTAYKYGEPIDYTGSVVHGIYSDGATEIITSQCEFSPSQGSPFNGEYKYEVTYKSNLHCSGAFTVIHPVRLVVVNPPRKHKAGEQADYTDVRVSAVYKDGTRADVTDKCAFDPPEGTVITSPTTVQITYTEGLDTLSAACTLETKYVTGISVDYDNSTKTEFYVGDTVDYSDIHIIAEYSDGSTEDITGECDFSVPKGKKLKDHKTKMDASYKGFNKDGVKEEFTLPLNEPVLKEVQELNAFVAPKSDVSDPFSDYPIFSVGYSQITPLYARKFITGTLIPYYITFGCDCESAYTEDAYGEKIGEWMTYYTIPDTTLDVWFIDPRTGQKMGSKAIPFKYNDRVQQVSREPQWHGYSVWGWDVDFNTGERGAKEIISARGPVYLDPAPVQSVKSIKPIIKDGKISWDITTSAIYPNEEEDAEVIVPVEDTDLPEGISDWLRLADCPSKLIEVTGNKAVFEIVSDGVIHRMEIDLSKFTLPPTYNKCTGIYTWANTATAVRNSQGETTYTEYTHMAKFSSDDDPNNEYYVTFKSDFKAPITEAVGLKDIQVSDNATYNKGDKLDYDEFQITAEYTNGTKKDIPPHDVTFSEEEYIALLNDTVLKIDFTDENGESASTEYSVKVQKLSRLTVLPPTRTAYGLYERVDYSGFQAIVQYVDGTTKDVTNDVKISSKGLAYITPQSERTVTVTYTEDGETVSATFEIEINSSGIWVSQQPDKRMYRIGDLINYTGIKIASNFGWVAKDKCVFSVKEGTTVTDTTDENITITYKDFEKEYTTSFEIFVSGKDHDKRIERLEIASYPVSRTFKKGDSLKFDGLRVMCYYTNGTHKDVTEALHFSVSEGSIVDSNTPRKITAKYSEELSGEFSVEFDLDIKILNLLSVSTRGMRKNYAVGDKLSYSGIRATCLYWGGEELLMLQIKLYSLPKRTAS